MLLAITYHYVVDGAPSEPRAIYPVTTSTLGRQLEKLGRTFEFVSRDDLLAALDGRSSLPEHACVVTFDDGLRCQYEHGLPVLDRLGVPGLFFVPGLPIAEDRVLAVHKAHRLREAMPDEWILAELGAEAPAASPAGHPYDEPLAAGVKDLLARRSDELDRLLERAGVAVDRELYMSREQIAELERRGMLGAHGYTHEADDDLVRGAAALEQATGRKPRTMSYPNGRPLAGAEAFAAAFTTERKVNADLAQPLLLGRFDTRDISDGRLAVELRPIQDRRT